MIITVFYTPDTTLEAIEYTAINACCLLENNLIDEIETSGIRILGKNEEVIFDYVNDRIYILEQPSLTPMGYHRQSYWFDDGDFKFKPNVKEIAVLIDPQYPTLNPEELLGLLTNWDLRDEDDLTPKEYFDKINFSNYQESIPFMILLLTTSENSEATLSNCEIVQHSNSLIGKSIVLGLPASRYLEAAHLAHKFEREEIINSILENE